VYVGIRWESGRWESVYWSAKSSCTSRQCRCWESHSGWHWTGTASADTPTSFLARISMMLLLIGMHLMYKICTMNRVAL